MCFRFCFSTLLKIFASHSLESVTFIVFDLLMCQGDRSHAVSVIESLQKEDFIDPRMVCCSTALIYYLILFSEIFFFLVTGKLNQ